MWVWRTHRPRVSTFLQALRPHGLPGMEGSPFHFTEKPLEFLGCLMAQLALSCTEEDQEMSCKAAEALRAFHRFIRLRDGE